MQNNFQGLGNLLPSGTRIGGGRYRIVGFLNSGGFGNTYRAVDTRLTDESDDTVYVVVKEFYVKRVAERDAQTGLVRVSNPEQQKDFDSLRRKFIREAKRIYKLHHPGIVRVSDVIPDENGTSYYVMDYIEGRSLSEVVRENGPLTEERATAYIKELLAALEKVHAKRMLHLDIKPANIMLDSDGHAVLIDFGASKVLEESGSESSSAPMVYTQGYAPPEQMMNDLRRVGPASDLYSIGATLYNLLTARRPPTPTQIDDADTPEEAFDFPDGVGERLRNLIVRLMSPRYKSRPDNAAAVLDYLGSASSESQLMKKAVRPEGTDWYANVFAEPTSDPAASVGNTPWSTFPTDEAMDEETLIDTAAPIDEMESDESQADAPDDMATQVFTSAPVTEAASPDAEESGEAPVVTLQPLYATDDEAQQDMPPAKNTTRTVLIVIASVLLGFLAAFVVSGLNWGGEETFDLDPVPADTLSDSTAVDTLRTDTVETAPPEPLLEVSQTAAQLPDAAAAARRQAEERQRQAALLQQAEEKRQRELERKRQEEEARVLQAKQMKEQKERERRAQSGL